MSLPNPTTKQSPFPAFTKAEYDTMEPALLALASKSGGDLRKLLYAFFSFLNLRTDFYLVHNKKDVEEGLSLRMGFREGDAEKLLLAAYRQFPLRRMPRQVESNLKKNTPKSTSTKTKIPPASIPSVNNQRASSSNNKSDQKIKTNAKVDSSIKTTKTKNAGDEKPRFTEEGKQIPVGNGGTTKRYHWTQTLEEANVILKLPTGTRGKDLDVSLKASSISVRFKKDALNKDDSNSSPVLLEGDLIEKIRVEESTWSLEGSALLLTLDKLTKSWWETIIQGDDIIDSTMVDSTRKIDTYDEATQGYIRKILFDQRQERLGKPTSEEILMGDKVPKSLPPGAEFIDKKKMDEIRKNDFTGKR